MNQPWMEGKTYEEIVKERDFEFQDLSVAKLQTSLQENVIILL